MAAPAQGFVEESYARLDEQRRPHRGDLCGHAGTTVTEEVYRHQLRPVLLNGTVAMNRIFDPAPSTSDA